jgi:hypothetical protein
VFAAARRLLCEPLTDDLMETSERVDVFDAHTECVLYAQSDGKDTVLSDIVASMSTPISSVGERACVLDNLSHILHITNSVDNFLQRLPPANDVNRIGEEIRVERDRLRAMTAADDNTSKLGKYVDRSFRKLFYLVQDVCVQIF